MDSRIFQIKQGDGYLTSHSGLGLVGALLSRTSISERVNPDSPQLFRVEAIRLTITWGDTKGLARQYIVINEKRQCSILFHWLVPEGRGEDSGLFTSSLF